MFWRKYWRMFTGINQQAVCLQLADSFVTDNLVSLHHRVIAQRLNSMGVDAFVLKYRLLYTGPGAPTNPPSASLSAGERPRKVTVTGAYKAQAGKDMIGLAAEDGRQAVRIVREQAEGFGVRPDRNC